MVIHSKMIKGIKGIQTVLETDTNACRIVDILITDLSRSPPFNFLDLTFHSDLKMAYVYYLCTVRERELERVREREREMEGCTKLKIS